MPTTKEQISCHPHCKHKRKLTIKLDQVMYSGLPHGATALLLLQKTHRFRLALVLDQHESNRNRKSNQNDTKRSKGPTISRVLIKQLRNLRPSKRRRQPRAHIQTPHDHAVAKRSHVRDDNIDDVAQADVADPVERVAGCISLDVLAQSFQDHADDDEENHQQEAFAAAADVDDLGDGELADTSDDGAKDGCDG